MKNYFNKIPEQIKRLSIVVFILAIFFIIIRSVLIPDDFGLHGHYRSSAVDEIVDLPIHYAGHELCADCHDDIVELKGTSYHRDVSCEVCHGAAANHADDPDSYTPPAPRERGYCPLCHEYNPSRPTGFPQIISASHNPMEPCISCHDPHSPDPPETPKECSACHAEIARTKALSHHVNVPCTVCHNTPEDHRIRPREVLASKPRTRELCGSCHSEEATSERGIPRIDLASHEVRYVCWQCHYPHLPEVQ
jgi:hypothetical protein